jgi:hypothetical protein
MIKKELVDSILIAADKQKKYINTLKDKRVIRDYEPILKIKIDYSNGASDIIDFTMDSVLHKYFEAIDNQDYLIPISDTLDLSKMKHKCIYTVQESDSMHNLIFPAPPPDTIPYNIKWILLLTAGISKKLVTIFALLLDNFIRTPNLLPFTNFGKPGFAKIAPWCLARQDNLSAKEPGQLTGVTSPPTLSTYTRVPLALMLNESGYINNF